MNYALRQRPATCPAQPRSALARRAGRPRRWTIQDRFGFYLGLPCGVVIQDAKGIIMEANQQAVSMLGVNRRKLLGLSFADPCWRAADLSGGSIELSVEKLRNLRLRLVQPSGVVTWLQVRSQFLSSPGGAVEAVVSCFIDITAIVTAQDLVKKIAGMVPVQSSPPSPPPAWWEHIGKRAKDDREPPNLASSTWGEGG